MPRVILLALLLLGACKSSEPGAVHGFVVPGSIETVVVDLETVYTFTIEEKGKQTRVRHVGVVSDLFKDNAGVTVRGPIKDGVLQATELITDRHVLPR